MADAYFWLDRMPLAVEYPVSEFVLKVMLQQSGRNYAIGSCLGRSGFGYLKKSINGFNNAAKGTPFLILTDLDQTNYPPLFINEWLSAPKYNNLLTPDQQPAYYAKTYRYK